MNTTIWTAFVIASLLVSGLPVAAQGDASEQWQKGRLLEPSAAQRTAEQSGSVVIYDRLDEALVETALDSQFERIENMMFIRVQHPQPDGEVIEDDDC